MIEWTSIVARRRNAKFFSPVVIGIHEAWIPLLRKHIFSLIQNLACTNSQIGWVADQHQLEMPIERLLLDDCGFCLFVPVNTQSCRLPLRAHVPHHSTRKHI